MDLDQRISWLKMRIAEAKARIEVQQNDESTRKPAGLRDELSAGSSEFFQSGSGAQAEARNNEVASRVDGETLRSEIARIRQASRYRRDKRDI